MAEKPVLFGVITSGYGERVLHGVKEFHRGIDIGVAGNPTTTPIFVTKAGIVKWVDRTRVYDKKTGKGSFGNVVYILMADGWFAIYPHMEAIFNNIEVGNYLKEGTQIGIMGNTGFSFGIHLHYEERDSMASSGKSRCPQDIIDLYLND